MESNMFDNIIDRLQADASRRRLLAGLLGTATAVLAGAAGSDARKQTSKRRRRSNGGGARTAKVQICRRNRRGAGFSLIAVGQSAVPAHRRRGAIICPVPPECFVITGCSNGSGVCAIEPHEGAPCNDFYPAAGVCNAVGQCTELPIASG